MQISLSIQTVVKFINPSVTKDFLLHALQGGAEGEESKWHYF